MQRALVIDDDAGTILGFSGVLTLNGFEVLAASNGFDGLGVADGHSLDLILADLVLPDLSGVEVLRQLRLTGNRVPFVIVTGFGTTHSAVEAMRLGAADYVEKPLIGDELMSGRRTGVSSQCSSSSLAHPFE